MHTELRSVEPKDKPAAHAVGFIYFVLYKKKVVFLQFEIMAGTVLSLGSDAERKVRAARATMLPNGKRL